MTRRRLHALVDSCLLPSLDAGHLPLPDWLRRSLDSGAPGAAVHGYDHHARSVADAVRAALPDALIGRGDSRAHRYGLHAGRRAGDGAETAAGLVAAGANLHLSVRPVPEPGATGAFVSALQAYGVAAALGPFTGAMTPAFAEAAAADVRAVTVGHAPVPGGAGLPASLSVTAVTGTLRRQLGYAGVVVSDVLDAPQIVDGWGVPGAAVLAWIAGVDLVRLGPASGAGVHDAIHAAAARAVADGDLDQDRLEEAAARVARLRRWASASGVPATRPDARRAVAPGAVPARATVPEA